MAVSLLSPFLILFSRHPKQSTSEQSDSSDWKVLPIEIREHILDLVEKPVVTARVCRDFRNLSAHVYTVLLKKYAANPALIHLLSSSEWQNPMQKVQIIYLKIIREAKNCGIALDPIELHPFDPLRLQRIRELTVPRMQDKASFSKAVIHRIHRKLEQRLIGKTNQEIIAAAESSIVRVGKRLKRLDLNACHLSHLPSQIKYLKHLTFLCLNNNNLTVLPPEMNSLTQLKILSLRGNPLSPASIKAICNALPKLQTVVIDSEQQDLVEMFEEFRYLDIFMIEVIR